MTQLSTKPYLLRALYEWCVDSGHTPHIVAWVNEQTQVPMQYVRDNEIVLNIGPAAANQLTIDNEWVHFAARFAGVSHDIWIPVGHVTSIFARETGEGMGFEVEPFEPAGSDADAEGHLSLVDDQVGKDDGSPAIAKENTQAPQTTDTSPHNTQTGDAPVVKKGLRIVK